MPPILSVTVPFFALVLLGFVAAQRRLLPEAAIPGLNAYVLYFALPCMLFRFGASMPFGQLIDPALIAVYALCAVLVVGCAVGLAVRRGIDMKNAAFGALVSAFPNSGFMGVPLLVALFGDAASGPVIGTLLVDLFLTSTLCLALAQAHAQRTNGSAGASPTQVALRALRSAATNPQPWAIALGALTAAASLQLPDVGTRILDMLADSASPVALFTIGAVLWRASRQAQTRTPVVDYLPSALIKLLVHPALVGVIGLGLQAVGVAVSTFGLTILVLTAALPSASNVSLLAERYGADNDRVARIIMASTVLAFASFTLIAWSLSR